MTTSNFGGLGPPFISKSGGTQAPLPTKFSASALFDVFLLFGIILLFPHRHEMGSMNSSAVNTVDITNEAYRQMKGVAIATTCNEAYEQIKDVAIATTPNEAYGQMKGVAVALAPNEAYGQMQQGGSKEEEEETPQYKVVYWSPVTRNPLPAIPSPLDPPTEGVDGTDEAVYEPIPGDN